MPKKANPDLKTESGKYYKSHYRANVKYSGEGADADKDQAKVESVRLRVPKGWNQQMKDHVEKMRDYAEKIENPDDRKEAKKKYRSVNRMLEALIQQEIPDIFPDPDINKDNNE